jgi:hypothetical protein
MIEAAFGSCHENRVRTYSTSAAVFAAVTIMQADISPVVVLPHSPWPSPDRLSQYWTHQYWFVHIGVALVIFLFPGKPREEKKKPAAAADDAKKSSWLASGHHRRRHGTH